MRKEDLYEIVKNFVKTRKEDPYAFFTASLRMRKFKISCCDYTSLYLVIQHFSNPREQRTARRSGLSSFLWLIPEVGRSRRHELYCICKRLISMPNLFILFLQVTIFMQKLPLPGDPVAMRVYSRRAWLVHTALRFGTTCRVQKWEVCGCTEGWALWSSCYWNSMVIREPRGLVISSGYNSPRNIRWEWLPHPGKWREIQVVCDQPETSASSVFFVNLLALDVGCLFSRGCHRLRISLRLLLVDFFLKYWLVIFFLLKSAGWVTNGSL